MARRHTPAERAHAARLAMAQGDEAVAERFGVPPGTVAAWRRNQGLLKRPGRKPKARAHDGVIVADPAQTARQHTEARVLASPTSAIGELLVNIRRETEIAHVRLPTMLEEPGRWEDVLVDDAHNSTKLEGNKLERQMAGEVAAGRLTPMAAAQQPGLPGMQDALEVMGYADAARWLYDQALTTPAPTEGQPIITLEEVRVMHHRAMAPVWLSYPPPQFKKGEGAGSFRLTDLKAFPDEMTPVDHPFIQADMSHWADELNETVPAPGADVTRYLAQAHERFEQIHPFRDGNGRTGRLVMSMLALRLGYPPVVIPGDLRQTYLDFMGEAYRQNIQPLSNLIAACLLRGFEQLGVIEQLPPEVTPQRLTRLARDRGIAIATVRRAAERGRLRTVLLPAGVFGARAYHVSTHRWVDDYERSRYR